MLKEQEDALRYSSAIERQFFKVISFQIFFRATVIFRDLYNNLKVYKKLVMALANQTAEQVLRTVNLLSTKPSSYVVIEDNKIYVTVPLPDYHLPGKIFSYFT